MKTELKFLIEQRAEKIEKMKNLIDTAKAEQRALTEEQIEAFENLKKAIAAIDATIAAEEIAREEEIEVNEKKENSAAPETKETSEKRETRAFTNYIKGFVNHEKRAENLDLASNGAVIPTTIAQKIIERVKDICPIYSMAEIYHVKGTLVIPYYGDDAGEDVTCAYHNEFDELTSKSGKFTSVELGGFLAGALTKISKSLINNNDFGDTFLVNFIVKHVADAIAHFIEKELISGTGYNACEGILTAAQADRTAKVETQGINLKPDYLIDLQESIPDIHQKSAIWIMNSKTRAAIRKFKDGNGNFMLNPDLTSAWGYTLLGKPVYTSDSMPVMENEGDMPIIYGDLTGLTVNMHENMNIEVLREKFATQHALGVVGWLEIDSKVTDPQKLAVLVGLN